VKHAKENGYMTVEAALLFGFILMLFMAMFYLAFYLHDRAVLYETCAYYAEAMLHSAEEPVDLTGRLETERLEEQSIFRTNGYAEYKDPGVVEAAFRTTAKNRLLMSSVTRVNASYSGRKVRIAYGAEFHLTAGSFVTLWTGIEKEFSGEVALECKMDPEEFVRLCRGVIWRKKSE